MKKVAMILLVISLILLTSLPSANAQNGCGGEGSSIDPPDAISGIFDFTEACNHHDECYGTLDTPRIACDTQFLAEMFDSCPINYATAEACLKWALLYAGAVRAGGGEYYSAGQALSADQKAKLDDLNDYLQEGMTWFENGNYGMSLVNYDQAIRLFPSDPMLYYIRGNVNYAAGRIDDAFDDYDTAIGIDSEIPIFYFARGNLHAHDNKPQSAIADYQRYIELVGEENTPQEILDYVRAAAQQASTNPNLPETFVSSDGRLSFNYPSDWIVTQNIVVEGYDFSFKSRLVDELLEFFPDADPLCKLKSGETVGTLTLLSPEQVEQRGTTLGSLLSYAIFGDYVGEGGEDVEINGTVVGLRGFPPGGACYGEYIVIRFQNSYAISFRANMLFNQLSTLDPIFIAVLTSVTLDGKDLFGIVNSSRLQSNSNEINLVSTPESALFQDNFSNNQLGWETSASDPDLTSAISNGIYVITTDVTDEFEYWVTAPGIQDWSRAPIFDEPYELEFQVDIQASGGYGLVVLLDVHEGYSPYKRIIINDDGTWQLFRWTGESRQLLAEGTLETGSINFADNRPHSITLRVETDQYTLLIDGEEAAKIDSVDPISGTIGFGVARGSAQTGDKITAHFSNLVVRTPEKG